MEAVKNQLTVLGVEMFRSADEFADCTTEEQRDAEFYGDVAPEHKKYAYADAPYVNIYGQESTCSYLAHQDGLDCYILTPSNKPDTVPFSVLDGINLAKNKPESFVFLIFDGEGMKKGVKTWIKDTIGDTTNLKVLYSTTELADFFS